MADIIETKRLLLRPFTLDDLDAFYRLVSDPDVTRFTGDGEGDIERVRQGLVGRVLHDYMTHGFGRWATVLKDSGRVIGFAGLKHLPEVGEVDLGYRFLPEYWGQGLATEACRACLADGFDRLRLDRIIGIAHIANAASMRVLEKVGLRFEKRTTYQGGEVAWYGLAREEYLAARAAAP